jgi:hypothetical protein
MTAMLTVIWVTALGLVGLAFALLGGLIAARLQRRWIERAYPDRRAKISKALIHFAMADGPPPRFALSDRSERRLVVETALDAAQIMRGAAKERLIHFLAQANLGPRLHRQSRRGSLRDRLMAIEALRLFPDAETLTALKHAEASRDLRIWLAALSTRVAIGAGPDMMGMLELARRPGAARSLAMQDLVAACALANPPDALRALNGPLPTHIRALLLRAVGETRYPEAMSPLIVALCHPEGQVRSAAAGALGALGLSEAGGALAHATGDMDWRVRLKAVEAIRRLGLRQHVDSLKPLLADPVWWVRLRAKEAIEALRGPKRRSARVPPARNRLPDNAGDAA